MHGCRSHQDRSHRRNILTGSLILCCTSALDLSRFGDYRVDARLSKVCQPKVEFITRRVQVCRQVLERGK